MDSTPHLHLLYPVDQSHLHGSAQLPWERLNYSQPSLMHWPFFADTTRLKMEQDKTSSLMHMLQLRKISEKEYILVEVGYAHLGISIALSSVGIMWGSIAHQFLSMWLLQWDSDIAPGVCRLVQTWREKLCYWSDILNLLLIFIFRYTS